MHDKEYGVHPFNAMFSSPGVPEAVLEISPVVGLNSYGDTMPPEELLFQAQGGVQAVV